MARYIGPKCKKCRSFGEKLFLLGSKCFSEKCVIKKSEVEERNDTRRIGRKLSTYSQQLREKQKLKFSYGLLERQFKIYYEKAAKEKNTGEALLSLLERRLDNVLFRLGFAQTRAQARQLVSHGHILINGRATKTPSYLVKPEQIISVKDGKGLKMVKSITLTKEPDSASWLSLDREKLQGKVLRIPVGDDLKNIPCNIQLVVELYSK